MFKLAENAITVCCPLNQSLMLKNRELKYFPLLAGMSSKIQVRINTEYRLTSIGTCIPVLLKWLNLSFVDIF